MLHFLDFQYLTTEIGLVKEFKTKKEKAFFFILLSSSAEMSFWGSNKRKVTK
jgi:hypothetical protein